MLFAHFIFHNLAYIHYLTLQLLILPHIKNPCSSVISLHQSHLFIFPFIWIYMALVQWRLRRGGRLIIMSGTERMESNTWKPCVYVWDTIPPIPLQSLPRISSPQLGCHQPTVLYTHHNIQCTGYVVCVTLFTVYQSMRWMPISKGRKHSSQPPCNHNTLSESCHYRFALLLPLNSHSLHLVPIHSSVQH